jgi:hypothetical protein
MTRTKEIGYDLVNVLWRDLDGFQSLWNSADTETKDKIVNSIGELAEELVNTKKEMTLKIVKVGSDFIEFDNGMSLSSNHEPDCCEHHWLDFEPLELSDFEGLEFDFSNDNFFERIPDYGIALKPVHGHPVRVAGYGSNNGYYSSQLDLVLSDGQGYYQTWDITECQEWNDY